MNEWWSTLLLAAFASAGFWAFLRSMRGATSAEYQSFVRDLQAERKDRQEAIAALTRQLKRQDARLRRQAHRIAEYDLDLRQLEAHIGALEAEITRLGGTPPKRPARIRIELPADEEIEEEYDDASGDLNSASPPASAGTSQQ